MPETHDTIAAIVEELGTAFMPLVQALESASAFTEFMADLGWQVGAPIAPINDLTPILTQVAEAFEQPDAPDLPSALGQLANAFSAIRALSSISNAALPATVDATAFRNELPGQLLDYLVVEHLLNNRPGIGRLLQLAGVIRLLPIDAAGTRLAHVRRAVAWSDLSKMLSDPVPIFTNAYRWGQSDFDGLGFLRVVTHLGRAYGITTLLGTMESAAQTAFSQGTTVPLPPELKEAVSRFEIVQNRHIVPSVEAGIGVVLVPETASAMPGFAVAPYVRGTASTEFSTLPGMTAFMSADAALTGGIGLIVRPLQVPTLEVGFLGGATAASAKLTTGIDVSNEGEPIVILGQGGGSRIETQAFSVAGGTRIQAGSDPTAFVEARARGLALAVKPGPDEADGFLGAILPLDMRAEFDLTVGLESLRGFYFEGSGGLEILLPVHIALGPIEIQGVLIALKPTPNVIEIDLATTLKANLAVLQGVVENIGLRVFLKTPAGGGQLGPFDIEFGFRPPNGFGLQLDAGVVKGGGYLFFDFDREEYAGALELTISGFLSLKAIGLITTRMPDGSRGFSMLVIITAEFLPGLQLGYGFTLIGVGGLLGLHRTVVLDALATGVRTGAVNGIMFPVDPVANAPRIISDLRVIFPPYENRFLIGPMAKLGWGTPTIVSLTLGVIIEIPGNIAIVGVLQTILPDQAVPLLRLQVNFVGAIEFDKKRAWFFAALFESRLVFITLEGEMGMLIAIGEDANFVLSVGGFHPRFSAPALPFPSPTRIAFDIVNTPVAKIRAEAYFAVTTNTAQVGARAELFFGFDAFSVEGHVGFDALLRFSPFYLIVEIVASASLKAFGIGVFSIRLDFTLEGPTPWRARGRGSVDLALGEFSADFDVTWGESRDTSLPPIAVIPLLRAEFEKPEAWRALPPASVNLLVTLRKLALTGDVLVLHPLGTLEVSQSAIPLGLTLDKVGAQKLADANRFTLSVKSGSLQKQRDARRGFAPAQFRKLSDAQKLAAPAFEQESSGLELGVTGSELRTGRAVKRTLRYEVTTTDTAYRRFVRRFVALGSVLFGHFLKSGAVATSALSHVKRKQMQPFSDRIVVAGDRYAVVRNTDNRPIVPDSASFASESEASDWLRATTAQHPDLSGSLQVVPVTEMTRAA